MTLEHYLVNAAKSNPSGTAIKTVDDAVTYATLDALANQAARALKELGVRRGDRVGIWSHKSIQVVAAMQGVLRLGAVYVPIDPLSPVARARTILADCQVRAVVGRAEWLSKALTDDLASVRQLAINIDGGHLNWASIKAFSPEPINEQPNSETELAYILYTSGSTGWPKGVCISHRNAMAFIDWAKHETVPSKDDRLSNHAPFHFDLSVFDLYVAFASGARIVIVPEGAAYSPNALVDFVIREGITIWYSVPSALTLMMEQGGLLQRQGLPLRIVVFAGEPFPIKALKRLREALPRVRMLNWYGPTETNVCTSYEVLEIEPERTQPVPIGHACCGDRVWAQKPDGSEVAVGEEGELLVEGPTVLTGYWGKPPHGPKPYPTGDIVRRIDQDNYYYLGRRDHMVKVRGHRIELGEIEAALSQRPGIREVAVAVCGSGTDARLIAFVACDSLPAPNLLELKRHCAERLPRYMIVDEVRSLPALPRTGNGKIDRLRLAEISSQADQK